MSSISALKQFLLDLILPIKCIGCETSDSILCTDCLKTINPLSLQVCPYCEKSITLNGEPCTTCSSKFTPDIERVVIIADYQEELLAKAIHLFKYKFIKSLAKPLGLLLINNSQKLTIPTPDFILPIPLHPRRLRWRGFNQSELLANILASNLLPGIKIPVVNNFIIRHRYTPPQKNIKGYKKRHQNLDNVFIPDSEFDWSLYGLSSKNLTNKNILIIDDVVTTGATIFRFAKELKKLKPKSISVMALGRQH